MHRCIFVFIIMCVFNAEAQENKLSVETISREIQVSNSLSDRFKAYRLGAFLKDKRQDVFLRSVADDYLEALNRVTSHTAFRRECEQLSKLKNQAGRDQILYTCGRLLFDDYSLKKSQELLEQVNPKSPLYPPAAVLLASIYLSFSDGERCIRTLPPRLLKSIKNVTTREMFYLTRARCFTEIHQIDKGILEYQLISANSPYFHDAIEETAWAQFRIRHFESTRTLLDVLITTYESAFGDKRKISSAAYFRSRYLQAYIELVQRNAPRAEALFKSLREAIIKFEKENLVSEPEALSLASLVTSQNLNWIDMKAMPREVHGFLNLVKDWADPRFRKRLDHLIDHQFSLSRELKRLRSDPSSEFDSYTKNIIALEAGNRKTLEQEFIRAAKNIERSLRVMRIKADLGRIEIVWVDRAQGVRGIGELLESYQQEVNDVEDFFGQ